MLTPISRSIIQEHVLLQPALKFSVIRTAAAHKRIEGEVSKAGRRNFLLSLGVPALSNTLKVFLCGVMDKTYDIALIINCYKACADRNHVFDIWNVAWVQF